jgi:hypothetical protein
MNRPPGVSVHATMYAATTGSTSAKTRLICVQLHAASSSEPVPMEVPSAANRSQRRVIGMPTPLMKPRLERNSSFWVRRKMPQWRAGRCSSPCSGASPGLPQAASWMAPCGACETLGERPLGRQPRWPRGRPHGLRSAVAWKEQASCVGSALSAVSAVSTLAGRAFTSARLPTRTRPITSGGNPPGRRSG